MISVLWSGKKIFLTLAIFFFISISLVHFASASSCCTSCGSCGAHEVKVNDIIFERVDGSTDPTGFCGDDRIHVSAIVAVNDVWNCECSGSCGVLNDPEVRAELYVDGEYYGSASIEVSPSIYRRVDFSRLIYANDFPISSNIEVKVVAKTLYAEDERTEYFYVKDCEEKCDYCDCGVCGDYGQLKVKVKDCTENEPLADARVHVEGITDYTKITHYNGYAIFTLNQGEYTITASHEDYGEKEQKIYVIAGRTKEISICLSESCDTGYTGEFQCFGNYIQRQYIESDCTKQWKIAEYCQYGCMDGSCVQSTGQVQQMQLAKPTDLAAALISLKESYKTEKCEVGNFSFDIINIGSVETTFNLAVTGSAADLVFVPKSITIKPNERKPILAYAYSCDTGNYPFTVTASTMFAGEVVTTSANSDLKIAEEGFSWGESLLWGNDLLKTGWTTIILICVVVIVVLVVWRIKLGISFRLLRGQRPEEFESSES